MPGSADKKKRKASPMGDQVMGTYKLKKARLRRIGNIKLKIFRLRRFLAELHPQVPRLHATRGLSALADFLFPGTRV